MSRCANTVPALITLGFATISGVRLGLGYNSSVRTPQLEEITRFPFVSDGAVSGAGNDPMKILKVMTETSPAWVTPTNNSYWFAAGLTLVAFDILTVTAVAMVQFKEAGLIISIIADAVAQMPPGVTSRSEMIDYVEIGFICEMNMVDGHFRVEAALAPTSFLLVPQCRIYGGMALVYWFNVSCIMSHVPFSSPPRADIADTAKCTCRRLGVHGRWLPPQIRETRVVSSRPATGNLVLSRNSSGDWRNILCHYAKGSYGRSADSCHAQRWTSKSLA